MCKSLQKGLLLQILKTMAAFYVITVVPKKFLPVLTMLMTCWLLYLNSCYTLFYFKFLSRICTLFCGTNDSPSAAAGI